MCRLWTHPVDCLWQDNNKGIDKKSFSPRQSITIANKHSSIYLLNIKYDYEEKGIKTSFPYSSKRQFYFKGLLVGIGTGTLCVVGLVATAWSLVYTSKMTFMGNNQLTNICENVLFRRKLRHVWGLQGWPRGLPRCSYKSKWWSGSPIRRILWI